MVNRTKIVVSGLSIVVLVLLVFGVLRLVRSYTASQDARKRRDASFDKLAKLYDSDPFPNQENTLRMGANVVLLKHLRTAITNALSARDVPLPEMSPSQFKKELQTTLRDRLQANAPIVGGARVIPADFAFGFDRYVAANAQLPSEKDAPRLAQQLDMIENLVNEVYAAKLNSLRSVQRVVFEDTTQSTSEETDSRSLRRRRRSESDATKTSEMSHGKFFESQTFTLVVQGRQNELCDFLNRLASMQMFVVVRNLEMHKISDDLRPPQVETKSSTPFAGAANASDRPAFLAQLGANAANKDPKAVSAPIVNEPISKLPPSKRLVSGQEIDPLIEARVDLDVYNFKREGV